MSVDTLLLLAFWAALVPLGYIGCVDVLIPDLFTIPATVVGVILAFVFDPANGPLAVAAVFLGYSVPLFIDYILQVRTTKVRLGLGVTKGCGMLGAYLGIKYTMVALTLLFVLGSLVWVLFKGRVYSLALPMACAGFLASLLRLAGWP